jgi:hypothetical protein
MSVLRIKIPKMTLRVYAISLTVVLVAVLTNPSAERHYENLAQFYPWVNESLLADAKETVWRLSPPSERGAVDASFTSMKADEEREDSLVSEHKRWVDAERGRLIYTSLGILSVVTSQKTNTDNRCGTYLGPTLPRPISMGFLGCLFAKRPPTPEELKKYLEKERNRLLGKVRLLKRQTRPDQTKTYTLSGKGGLNAPAGSSTDTNSFRISGPVIIDTPPRQKDALYKMEALE